MAVDDWFVAAYDELRRLAARVGRGRHDTLNPTALVNEAWLKLAASPSLQPVSRLHFKRIAARAMRQVLVEAARRRGADKRGRGRATVTLDEELAPIVTDSRDLVRLDEALDALASVNPRQAAMVECRFFGGLDVRETAAALEISDATVMRDWRAARAWLAAELQRGR